MKAIRFLLIHMGFVGFVLGPLAGLCLLWHHYAGAGFAEVRAELEKLQMVALGDCSACHKGKRVLPADHVDTHGMTYKRCAKCHKQGTTSLRGRMTVDHMHRLSGVKCDDCHEKVRPPEPVSTEKCLSCHCSYQEVAERTANLDPNPHNSLHYGIEVECDLCHHQHCDSENFCSQCHEWQIVVP